MNNFSDVQCKSNNNIYILSTTFIVHKYRGAGSNKYYPGIHNGKIKTVYIF